MRTAPNFVIYCSRQCHIIFNLFQIKKKTLYLGPYEQAKTVLNIFD